MHCYSMAVTLMVFDMELIDRIIYGALCVLLIHEFLEDEPNYLKGIIVAAIYIILRVVDGGM